MLNHYRFILTLVLCLLCLNVIGQKPTIRFGQKSVLYVGESAPIDISFEPSKRNSIAVDVSSNLQYHQTESLLTGLSKGVGLIRLGTVKKQDTLWVDSLYILVQDIPPLKAKFGTLPCGRKVPKTVLAIQKTIAIDCDQPQDLISQHWKVISYRVHILSTNSSKVFECQGFQIPGYISNYIRNHTCSYVLVDQILAVNTKSLKEIIVSPIHFEVQSKDIQNEVRLIQVSYKDTSGHYKQFNLITEDPFIDTVFLDVDSGSIKTIGPDYQFERIHVDRVMVKQNHYDHFGRLDYQLKRIHENKWSFNKYDSNSVVVLETTVNDTLHFYGSKKMELFLNINVFGLPDSSSLEHDVVSFYEKYHYTPIDSFITRYGNGVRRVVGNLKLRVGTHETWDMPRCGNIGLDEMPNDMSVLDGKWVFYDEKGDIVEQTDYIFGETQED